MSEKKEIRQGYYKGERPLFGEKNLYIEDTIFDEGESPLKESSDIELKDKIDPSATQIICPDIGKRLDHFIA